MSEVNKENNGTINKGRKAVVILSGGLDSTTCMGIAREDGYDLYPITYDYGQKHRIEIQNARCVSDFYGVSERHKMISLDFLREFGGSALTDDSIDVPVGAGRVSGKISTGSNGVLRNMEVFDTAISEKIPVTYVPGRNLLFLSIAASYAEIIGADAIYIGVNALDYSGYPDCRPEFIRKVEEVITVATKVGVEGDSIRVATPLIQLSKADIVREGMRLEVPYHLTTSCYLGHTEACGHCDSCRLRLKGFAEAGLKDPIVYTRQWPEAMIFDLDGTLFQSETILLPAYHQTFDQLRKEGLFLEETPDEKLILGCLGMLLRDIWTHVMPTTATLAAKQRADQLLIHYQLEWLQKGSGVLYPEVESTLTQLHKQGIRLFVASNGLESYVKQVIAYQGLAHLFEGLYSAGEFQTESKVDLVKLLLEKYSLTSAWMVGDRSSDVEAGKGNGLYVVGCDYAGFGKKNELAGSDVIITAFSAILER